MQYLPKSRCVQFIQQLNMVAIRLRMRAARPAAPHQHHMQEQKAARQLSTPLPLTPHHTTNQIARGGSGAPVNHAGPEAVPTYPLLASHARTSMHGTPASHAPRLPTSGPNPQTPACLVGCPPFPEQGPNGKTPTSPPIRIPRIANPAFVPFGNGGQLG
jgi:hypothetical protein